MIKKFNDYNLNENMGYKSFFGKEVSHEKALQERIRSLILNVIMDERKISEKSFGIVDEAIKDVKELCKNNTDIYSLAEQYYQDGKRLKLLAEEVYDKYIKNNYKNEKI